MAAIQPSLRDFVNFGIGPGVETPGYYHDVPPGQRPSIGVYTILLVRLSLLSVMSSAPGCLFTDTLFKFSQSILGVWQKSGSAALETPLEKLLQRLWYGRC